MQAVRWSVGQTWRRVSQAITRFYTLSASEGREGSHTGKASQLCIADAVSFGREKFSYSYLQPRPRRCGRATDSGHTDKAVAGDEGKEASDSLPSRDQPVRLTDKDGNLVIQQVHKAGKRQNLGRRGQSSQHQESSINRSGYSNKTQR